MNLAILSARQTVCFQCGEDLFASVMAHCETASVAFCRRCGCPLTAHRFDPLQAPLLSAGAGRSLASVNKRAKLVLRFGVLGLGVVGLLTGLLLSYGGWVNAATPLDPIQLWVSRIGGPLLLVQGLAYIWIPFRLPARGAILRFTPRRR